MWACLLQEGEETWLLAGRLEALALEEGGAAAEATGLDVPAVHLGDPDSRWAECSSLRLHYKLALPPRVRHMEGRTVRMIDKPGCEFQTCCEQP